MTDLVGSTAMVGRVGPEAAEELRTEHFGLLRGALERSAGREVKNLGDGLMVVFASAAQALTCGVEMQQAVQPRRRPRSGYSLRNSSSSALKAAGRSIIGRCPVSLRMTLRAFGISCS